MSFAIGVPTLVQCQNASITWTAPTNVNRTIQVFVEGDDYFSETVASPADLVGAAGSLNWLVDYPAGSSIALEIYDTPDATEWSTSYYFTVLASTTDSCLLKNPGVIASASPSLAALVSSLESASPQLFTYASTATTSSKATSSSHTSSATSSSGGASTITGSPAVASPTSSSSNTAKPAPSSVNGGAIAGGVVGGLAFLTLCGFIVYFLSRRDKASTNASSGYGPTANNAEKGSAPILGGGGGGGGDSRRKRARSIRSLRDMNPIEAWRGRISQDAARDSMINARKTPPSPDGWFTGIRRTASRGLYGLRAGIPEVQDGGLSAPADVTYYPSRPSGDQSRGSVQYPPAPVASSQSMGGGIAFPGGLYAAIPTSHATTPPSQSYSDPFTSSPMGSGGMMVMSNLAGGQASYSSLPTAPPPPAPVVSGTPVPPEVLEQMHLDSRGRSQSFGTSLRPPTRLATPGAFTGYSGEYGGEEDEEGEEAEVRGASMDYPTYHE